MTATQSHSQAGRSAPPPPPKDVERDIVAEAALAALEQAGGEQVKAAEAMKACVERDAKLKKALLEPLVAYACHQAVGLQIRQHRDRVWNPPVRPAQPSQRDQMMSIVKANLLTFPLPGGKMLGDATREEVLAGATFYATQAKDMAHKARWLKAVHDGMGNSVTVSAVFDDDRLAEMQKAAA